MSSLETLSSTLGNSIVEIFNVKKVMVIIYILFEMKPVSGKSKWIQTAANGI